MKALTVPCLSCPCLPDKKVREIEHFDNVLCVSTNDKKVQVGNDQQKAQSELEMRVCKTLCPQLYACP